MGWPSKGLDGLVPVYAILFFPAPIFWLLFHPAIHSWRGFGIPSLVVALPVWLVSANALIRLGDAIWSQRIDRSAFTRFLGAFLVGLAVWLNRPLRRQFSLCRLLGLWEVNRGGAGGAWRAREPTEGCGIQGT